MSAQPPAAPPYASRVMLQRLGWTDEAIREHQLERKREAQRERRRQEREYRALVKENWANRDAILEAMPVILREPPADDPGWGYYSGSPCRNGRGTSCGSWLRHEWSNYDEGVAELEARGASNLVALWRDRVMAEIRRAYPDGGWDERNPYDTSPGEQSTVPG
jgi:hypothetical protein